MKGSIVTLEQLRVFVAVAEREHVTEAARALNLTQSAVSNAVAALEERHGVRLFDRVGRGIRLNDAGRLFLDEARGVLARVRAAEPALAAQRAGRRGHLGIFASQTIAGYWLPERLVRFHDRYPGVELELRVGNTRQAARAVLEGALELGLVEGDVDDPALVQESVGSDRLVVLVRPGHAWEADPPSMSQLMSARWVLRERGSGTRASLEQALAAAGCDVGALAGAMALPSNEAVIAAGRLVRVGLDLPSRTFRLIRHRERYRSRAADAFADMLDRSA